MAVVFISPKKRQRVFFVGITIMFLLFIGVISLGIIFSKPTYVPTAEVFNKAKINIDMSIFDSGQFQNLQAFPAMEPQYSYTASTVTKKPMSGFLSAASIEQARSVLQGMGLNVSSLKEVEIGRNDPFTPYYQQVVTTTSPTTPNTGTTNPTNTNNTTNPSNPANTTTPNNANNAAPVTTPPAAPVTTPPTAPATTPSK